MFMIDLGSPSYYSLLGVSPDASVADIRGARDDKIKDLVEKIRGATSEKDRRELEERQKEINAAGAVLVPPEKREAYDQANAHLKFFTLRTVAAPMFTEKMDSFVVLHRAIRSFLAAKGQVLAPLSDVERHDFGSDETPVELLDALLR